jgi:inositol phosphorylceramide mannosyltransferase catalytic subunit
MVRFVHRLCLLLGQFNLSKTCCLFCMIVTFVLCVHVILTGRFLIEHFFASEHIDDMLTLDMATWRQANPSNCSWKKTIPRHIHQIWISSIDNKHMGKQFQRAANFCQHLNANYNYTLWTYDSIRTWLKADYSWFVSTYENYHYDMQRIDAMKYFLLFHFGGIYIDLDVLCNAQDILTAMIPTNRINDEPDIIFHMGQEGIAANTDIMAAKQFHPFFKFALNRLKSANRWFYLYHLTIILSAGPTFLHGIYRQYPFKETIYLIPNHDLWGRLVDGVGGATWYGRDTRLLIFFIENRMYSIIVLCLIIVSILCMRKVWMKTRSILRFPLVRINWIKNKTSIR